MKSFKMYYLLVVLQYSIIAGVFSDDVVNKKFAVGSDVVVAAIRRVQDTCIFNNDLLFMRRVAFYESNDGNDLKNLWNTDKGRAGIWQNDEEILEEIKNSTTALAKNQREALTEKLSVNITDLSWASGDLEIPLNSIAAARMFVSTFEGSLIPLDLKGQAAFWEKYYKNPESNATAQDFINSSNKITKCKPPGMDLLFIIDSSGSIGDKDFERARNFMTTVINSSRSNENNRIGILRFSDDAQIFLNLTNNFDAAFHAAATLPYDAGVTNMISAFKLAIQIFARNGRMDVPLVALLITDGQANTCGDPAPAAEDLKSLGVNLFTIGVGAEATTDLHIWASSPNCMFYYDLNGYTQLATVFPELLNAQICDVATVAPDTQTSLPGTVDENQSLYYQVPANTSTGLTLKLDIHEGAATVYASLTSRLPSAADYDFVANATSENLGQIYISPENLHNAQSGSFRFVSDLVKSGKAEVTVFTAIVGLTDSTNFTLHYEPHDTEVTVSTPTMPTTEMPKIETSTTEMPTTEMPKIETSTTEMPTTTEMPATTEMPSTTEMPTTAEVPTTTTTTTMATTTTTTPKITTTTINVQTPASPVSGNIENGHPIYYQLPAKVTDGITLSLTVNDGLALIFVSLTKIPSSDNYDYFETVSTNSTAKINISPKAFGNHSLNLMNEEMPKVDDTNVFTTIMSLAAKTKFTLSYGPDDTVVISTTPILTTGIETSNPTSTPSITTSSTPPTTTTPITTTTSSSTTPPTTTTTTKSNAVPKVLSTILSVFLIINFFTFFSR